jgi:hypothetical protein
MDSSLADINDVYTTPDGSVTYVLADDTNETSLYRWKFYKWERVLCIADGNNYLLRGAPDDNDVLYVADYGGTAIYYSSDAGENRWYVRAAPSAFTDLAVESADICYIGIGGDIRKSVNSGFTWELAVTPELAGGNVSSLTSVGEDQLIVGGVGGRISYSTDGADTFAKIAKPMDDAGATANAYGTAASLETGEYIYANSSTVDSSVWFWEVGWTSADDWQNIGTTMSLTYANTYSRGITLLEGTLYSTYTDGAANTEVVRCLNPSSPVGANKWSNLTAAGRICTTDAPTAINVTKGGSNLLWFVDEDNSGWPFWEKVATYEDTLADMSPEVMSPEDGLKNPVNPVTGRSVDIAFNWLRPSVNVNLYDIEIYTDVAGLNTFLQCSVYAPGPKGVVLIGPYQGAGNPNFVEWVAGQTYYWRVRVSPRDALAADMYGPTPPLDTGPIYSQWSDMRSIIIEAGEASTPSILSPEIGGAVTSTTPAFSWSPITGATMYEFVLTAGSTDADLAAPIVSAELAVPAYRVTEALTDGQTYFWRVRVIAPVEGPWSPLTSFTVEVPAAAAPPVVVKETPPPEIVIETPPPPPEIVIPPPPEQPAPIAPGYIWAVIIIGAILVIAVIVLIVRTRRTV